MLLVFPFAALHSHLANFDLNLSNAKYSITTEFSDPIQNLKVVGELKLHFTRHSRLYKINSRLG